MPLDRRHFILASLACVAGCTTTQQRASSMPGMNWPDLATRPPAPPSSKNDILIPKTPTQPEPVIPGPLTGRVIPRSSWARGGPLMREINPMNGVNCITIHHEGNPQPVYFTDRQTTAAALDNVRNAHRARGWGDIGYHFVVDRAGHVWEGRNLSYQGAHVKNRNEHNIGVMCLGNFDLQTPSEAQVASLQSIVRDLRRQYKISPGKIYTHQEIGQTACPGRNLQPRIVAMRSRNLFA